MKRLRRFSCTVVILFCFAASLHAADESPSTPAMDAQVTDIITLKNGTVIYGEVIEMSKGELQIKTPFSTPELVKVKWADVVKLTVDHPIPFHLKEGTVIMGTAESTDEGMMVLKAAPTGSAMSVPLDSVVSLNPLIQPPVVYTGSIQAGFSQTTGNSSLRNASLLGEFSGRSESLRLTILGRYIYGDEGGKLLVRNSRGTIKLDFFITKRWYWFAAAYFEQDSFQDLKLRTALSSGPGYQFIEKGDFGNIFKDLTFYGEAGVAYFNEDFKLAEDKTSTRARISAKLDWPLINDKVMFYHYIELFPSLQATRDVYLTADTGIRFKIINGFVSGFQWTLRFNNRPPAGRGDTDNLYLWTLGYSFDTSRKR